MTSGYRQAESQFSVLPDATAAKRFSRPWRFLEVERFLKPGETFEEVQRQLKVGAQTGFKVWMLSRPLQVVGIALSAVAALGAFRAWQAHQDVVVSLGTIDELTHVAILFVAGLVVPQLVAIMRYRQTIRGFGIKSLLAALLAFAFKLHLLVIDPWFLRFGSLKQLRAGVGGDNAARPD
jgi:hypothetical protein